MKKIKIPTFEYKNSLGSVTLKNMEISLETEAYEKYKDGFDLEVLDYGLSGRVIEKAESQIAVKFFKTRYREILNDKYQLKVEELVAIQDLMGLNNIEFATILGVDKGSYSNIIKRGKMSHPVGLLAIERLGMELSRPGSAKRLVDRKASLSKADGKISKEINEIRYGPDREAS